MSNKKKNAIKKGSQEAVDRAEKLYVEDDEVQVWTLSIKKAFCDPEIYLDSVIEDHKYFDEQDIVVLKKRYDRVGNFVKKYYMDRIVSPKIETFVKKMQKAEILNDLTDEEISAAVVDNTYAGVAGTLLGVAVVLCDARAFFHHRKERRTQKKLVRAAKKAARKAAKENK